jgi:hypothetical protein
MSAPADRPTFVNPTDPQRSNKIAWRMVGAAALAPHVALVLFIGDLWVTEARVVNGSLQWHPDSAYAVMPAWLELLILPAELVLGTILAIVRSTRRVASAVFGGAVLGMLLIAVLIGVMLATIS